MLPLDSVTGKSRGYVVLKAKQEWNYESDFVNHGKRRIQFFEIKNTVVSMSINKVCS